MDGRSVRFKDRGSTPLASTISKRLEITPSGENSRGSEIRKAAKGFQTTPLESGNPCIKVHTESQETPTAPKGIRFPYLVKVNSRTGRVKKWKGGKFGTYFRIHGIARRSSFSTFEKAVKYLQNEFHKLDNDPREARSIHELQLDYRTYEHLEYLLAQKTEGVTLRDTVRFYLDHHSTKQFEPRTVSECSKKLLEDQRHNNNSPMQIKTLEKHLRRFNNYFGSRKIHEVKALEISDWLHLCVDPKTKKPWKASTKKGVLGSLCGLANFSRDVLRAIPDSVGKTEFQRVRRPKPDPKSEVEIYTPEELEKLLLCAIEHDVDLIPLIVLGAFQGLRPTEAHGEGVKWDKLGWTAFNWETGILEIIPQKVRTNPARKIPIHEPTKRWLQPFKKLEGAIWRQTHASIKALKKLHLKAGIRRISNGFRHSYASYRIIQLEQKTDLLAAEMGNSSRMITSNYKNNVIPATASQWFSVFPPMGYEGKIALAIEADCPAKSLGV